MPADQAKSRDEVMMTHSTMSPATDRDRARPQLRVWSRRAVLITTLQALVGLASSCTVPRSEPSGKPAATNGEIAHVTPKATSAKSEFMATPGRVGSCAGSLPTVVPPTPIPYPGYAQEEPTTGLHVTSNALAVDLASYRLKVSGLVDRPLSLSYDDLRCLPKIQAEVKLECPGFFIDWTRLAGPTLVNVIALAGPQRKADRVTLISINGYTFPLSLEDAQVKQNFLAYEWRGEPLPPSHGFPVRAALPGRAGSAWVKWLEEIQLS